MVDRRKALKVVAAGAGAAAAGAGVHVEVCEVEGMAVELVLRKA